MYVENDHIISSLIGSGSHFRGNLVLSGILHINGDFTGSIESDGQVIIGNEAKVACDIQAAVVVIGGSFLGTIRTNQKVFVLENADVNGNIFSPRCIVEKGSKINGELFILPPKEKREYERSQAAFTPIDHSYADQ